MATVVHPTTALCPRCDEVLAATIEERGGDAWLHGACSRHGEFAGLYFRDAAFYRALSAVRNPVECCSTYDCARGEPCSRRAARTMIYMVNVTNNCNMTCDACLSGSAIGKQQPYRPAHRLLAPLPDARGLGFSPHAVLFGGEPTMHPELADIVRELTTRGYIPRLATNGLKLRNRDYARQLSEAGLKWIFLHFDSLDERRNRTLRGRPMVGACTDVIRIAHAVGMKVQFGMTVYRDNLDELRNVLRFAHEHGVFWLSLYPVADIERPGSSGQTYLTDVIDALAAQTNGAVARDDFLTAARLWSRLHRLTGRYNYRQKPTMVSLPIIVRGDTWVPVTRLIGPAALAHPMAAWRLLRSLPSLADYEHRAPSGDTLVVNIQQFQGRGAFDLEEAVHTLMSYAEDGSFIPFDVYNHVNRWAEPHAPAASLVGGA